MITLSAAQAISPAIERTKQFLFRPFRLGTFLKLALVAFLTEGGMTTCNFSSRLPTGNNRVPDAPHPNFQLWHMHWPAIPIVIAVTAVILLIVIPIVLLIAYLLIRLRFSYFDCVLRQQHRIAPAWSLYHRQAMRYLGLSLCINVFFWAYLAVAGIAIYTHFKPLFEALGSDNKPGFAVFLPVIGIVILLAMVLALISLFVETALGYFVLPHMALEDASIADALSDVWSDVTAEPWQFLLFVILRVLITLAASIVAVIALLIPLLIVGAIGAVAAIMLKTASSGVLVLLGVPAIILVAGIFVVAIIAVGGTIGTFRRNYALMFYGGRYPQLGDILQPPLPPSPLPPWQPGIVPGTTQGIG